MCSWGDVSALSRSIRSHISAANLRASGIASSPLQVYMGEQRAKLSVAHDLAKAIDYADRQVTEWCAWP